MAVAVAAVAATAVLLVRPGGTADAGSVSADVTFARARADEGAAVDVSEIAVLDALSPGGTYRLPSFGIRNAGTGRATFRLGVAHVQGQVRRPAPAEWFRFAPATFVLEAGRTRPVSARLAVPGDAEPGDYAALVGAWLAPARDGGRAAASSATPVTFGVGSPGVLERWKRPLGDHWTWLVVALILVAWHARRHAL